VKKNLNLEARKTLHESSGVVALSFKKDPTVLLSIRKSLRSAFQASANKPRWNNIRTLSRG
jgi:hypothetical protein